MCGLVGVLGTLENVFQPGAGEQTYRLDDSKFSSRLYTETGLLPADSAIANIGECLLAGEKGDDAESTAIQQNFAKF